MARVTALRYEEMTAEPQRVVLLGQPRLEPSGFARPKSIAFLAYLLLEGKQTRQTLSELFWGGSQRSENSLRNQLFQLRDLVRLESPGQFIEFAALSDFASLQQHLEQGDDLSAVHAYTGEFLAGFVAPPDSQLGEWLFLTRQFIKRQILEAHLRLWKSGKDKALLESAFAVLQDSDSELRTWFLGQLEQTQTQTRHNLPQASSILFGREHEQRLMLERLASAQWLTLVGLGGIGKTRLALGVAEAALQLPQCADGVFWVPLESAQSPSEVLWRIAQALEARLETEPMRELQDALKNKKVLLVLDNLEHLSGVATDLQLLFDGLPDLRLLCTSREVLGMHAEHVYPLSGLPPEIAQALLLARAPSVNDLETVQAICALLLGIPLALELAAAQLQTQSPKELLLRLQQSMDGLVTTAPELPERQRSLRAVFLSSWVLLSAPERAALERMALFRGGATRAALGKVADISLSVLAKLIDASLVQRYAERYTVHPLILEFVGEFLRLNPDFALQQERYGLYYLNSTASQLQQLQSPEAAQAMQKLTLEQDNLLMAWRWAIEQQRYSEMIALEDMVLYFDRKGIWQQGVEFFTAALESQPKDDPAKAVLLIGAAWLCYRLGRFEVAIDCAERVLQLQTPVILRSKALNTLASVNAHIEHNDQAILQYQQILELPLPIPRRITILVNLAKMYFDELQTDNAQTSLQEAKILLAELDNKSFELQISISLSEASFFDKANDAAPLDFVQDLLKVYHHSKAVYKGWDIYFELYLATFYWRSGNTEQFLYFINLFFLHSIERRVLPLVALAYLLVGQYMADSIPTQSRAVLGQALQLAHNLNQKAIFMRVAIFFVVQCQDNLPIEVLYDLESRAKFLWQKKQLATVQVTKKQNSAIESDALVIAQHWLLEQAKKSGTPVKPRAIPNIFWVSEG